MTRKRAALVLALILGLAGFGAWRVMSVPGDSTSGFHVVDGYWLGPESTCPDANSSSSCDAAVQAAIQVLASQSPGAVVVRAAIAPPSCDSTTYRICTTAGLYKGIYVVFDLRDSSRQVVGLICQGTVTEGSAIVSEPNCRPYGLTNQTTGN